MAHVKPEATTLRTSASGPGMRHGWRWVRSSPAAYVANQSTGGGHWTTRPIGRRIEESRTNSATTRTADDALETPGGDPQGGASGTAGEGKERCEQFKQSNPDPR